MKVLTNSAPERTIFHMTCQGDYFFLQEKKLKSKNDNWINLNEIFTFRFQSPSKMVQEPIKKVEFLTIGVYISAAVQTAKVILIKDLDLLLSL